MKVKTVQANNRKKCFELTTSRGGEFCFPFALLEILPSSSNPIEEVYVDPELGREAFTYLLQDGQEGSVHIDWVLEYNRDPAYMKNLLLYKLTVEALEHLEASELSRREIIRRLGTSASQFYRLLDTTNYKKSIGQMLELLDILGCDVELIVTDRSAA